MVASALLVALIAAATVSIREFDLPTRDARPHDPAVAPDASLWVTEQQGNKLASFNGATMAFENEFLVPTPNSAPNDIVFGPNFFLWFTELNADKVTSFDPNTTAFAEQPVP